MNAVVQQNFGAISTKFSVLPQENDLSAGIDASYPLMKYKGKVWTTSHKGEERSLMREDGDGPRNSIDVVIVKAPKVKSKIYYAKGYVEGSVAAPDCWSTNGLVPDARAEKKQWASCALCPQNKFGSRISEAGKKGKACQDSKRIAIVPANTTTPDPEVLRNLPLGGPMLLRIPGATLEGLGLYGEQMTRANFPYQAVVTRIAFDTAEAYPKFTFAPVRPLSDEEANVILELVNSPQVERILAEDVVVEATEEPKAPEVQFIVPQAPVFAPTPGPTTTMAAAPAVAPAPVTPAVTAQPSTNGFGSSAPVGNVLQTQTASSAPAPLITPTVAPLPAGFEAELDKLLG